MTCGNVRPLGAKSSSWSSRCRRVRNGSYRFPSDSRHPAQAAESAPRHLTGLATAALTRCAPRVSCPSSPPARVPPIAQKRRRLVARPLVRVGAQHGACDRFVMPMSALAGLASYSRERPSSNLTSSVGKVGVGCGGIRSAGRPPAPRRGPRTGLSQGLLQGPTESRNRSRSRSPWRAGPRRPEDRGPPPRPPPSRPSPPSR